MQRAPEIEALVRRFYDALAAGDAAFVDGSLSRREGVLGVGTDPREWWDGADRLAKVFKQQLEEMGGQLRASPGDLRAYREGDVAWFADNPTFRLADGTELAVRITGVFRRDVGTFRCVQWHASIGVANQEAIGKELTV